MDNKFTWIGAALIFLGILGFGTVADDLDHEGELFVVSFVLLTGFVLLAVSFFRRKRI